jgi:hypothetical protein
MNTKTILGISLTAAFAVSMIFATDVLAAGSHLDVQEDSKYQVNKAGVGKLIVHTEGKIPTDGSAGAFGYGVITGFVDHDNDSMTDPVPENVLALTTHKCVSDHPFQSNATDAECSSPLGVLTLLTEGAIPDENHDGADMHAHILDLMTVVSTSSCTSHSGLNGLEVDVVRTLEGIPTSVLPGNPEYNPASEFQPNNLVAGVGGGYDVKVAGENVIVKQIPSTDLSGTSAAAIVSFGIVALDDGSLTSAANDGIVDRLCLT